MWQSGCNSEWVSFLWNCHWKFKHVAAARNWNLKFTFPPIPNSAKTLSYTCHMQAVVDELFGIFSWVLSLSWGRAGPSAVWLETKNKKGPLLQNSINFLSQRSEQKTPPIQVCILQNVGFWALCQDLVGSNLCLPNQSELPLYWIWGHAWKTTYWGWGCSFCKLFSQVIVLTWAFQWGSQWSIRIKVKLL